MSSPTNIAYALQAIANHFGLGTIISISSVVGTNQNYFVATGKGQYFFKITLVHSHEDIEKELAYVQRLEQCQFPAAYYLAAPDGSSTYLDGDGKIAIIQHKLEGEKPEATETVCHVVATNLARLHQLPTAGLPQKQHWLSDDYLKATEHELASKHAEADTIQAIKRIYDRLQFFHPAAFPQSIIHGDLHPNNCLFAGNELVAFIDWEEVGLGAPLLDFARGVLGFCFIDQSDGTAAINQQLLSSFFNGYTQVRPFTHYEYAHIETAVKYVCLTQLVFMLRSDETLIETLTQADLRDFWWILDTWKL